MSNWNQLSLQDPSSKVMIHISDVHDSIMILLMFIVAMISYIFMSSMFSKLTDLKFFSNEVLESLWVTLPMIALLILAIPSLHCLYLMEESSNPLMTIKAVGHQWYWSYEYDAGIEFEAYMSPICEYSSYRLLETDNSIIIPVGVEVRILTTSTDVIHSFSMPSMGLKMDAIPGRINQMLLTSFKLGKVYGQCSEMCGAMHSFMPISMEVIPLDKFYLWLRENGSL
nr:cytochrome c oxidase subunit 2 [Linognathus africanus]